MEAHNIKYGTKVIVIDENIKTPPSSIPIKKGDEMIKAKYKIVHYLNQFFGQEGREEAADIGFIVKNGPVGPGIALKNIIGDRGDIVATVIPSGVVRCHSVTNEECLI